MKDKLFKIIIVLSIIVSSIVAFVFFIQTYMQDNIELLTQINSLIDGMGIYDSHKTEFFAILLTICVLIFLSVEFIVYKIIFKFSKVKVNELKLLIAVGSGLTLSFIMSDVLIAHLPAVAVTIIANVVSIATVYGCLYDDIKNHLSKCVICRGLLLFANVAFSAFAI